MPGWLRDLNAQEGLPALRLRELLNGSLYYPASGRSGTPVTLLGGIVYSFVFVDYGFEREEVLRSLEHAIRGFKGYSLISLRDVNEVELAPNGWIPDPFPEPEDGDLRSARGIIKHPFALWCIFERRKSHGLEHGPERFSVLYIGGEGAATFQVLYRTNRCVPEIIAIINPGNMGGEWTRFRDPARILGRSVLGNPTGRPKYVLADRLAQYGETCFWPAYSKLVRRWDDRGISLWELPD